MPSFMVPGGMKDSFGEDALQPQSTSGEVLESEATSTAANLPSVKLLDDMARSYANGMPAYQGDGIYVQPGLAGNDIQDKDTINQDNPLVKATGPMSASAAASIQSSREGEANRQSLLQRAPDSFALSALKIGVGLGTSFLDPINLTAGMLPVFPEAWQAASIVGRVGQGLVEGGVAQASLEPLQYGLDKADGEDYDGMAALQRVAFGAGMGGILHGLFGRAPQPTETAAITKSGLADMLEGRPVDVAPLADHLEASAAAERLQTWAERDQRALAESDALGQSRLEPTPDLTTEISASADRVAFLRASEDALSTDLEATAARSRVESLDPETSARVSDIDQELATVIPKKRRADLNSERTSLVEGERPQLSAPDDANLEQGRTNAEAAGLQAELDRTTAARTDAEASHADLLARDQANADAADAARTSLDRSTRIRQAALDGQRAIAQNGMEREVRRFASRIGTRLEDGEATHIAKELQGATAEELPDVLANRLNDLGKRSRLPDLVAASTDPTTALPNALAQLRQHASDAASQAVTRKLGPYTDPRLKAYEDRDAAFAKTAPAVLGGDLDRQLTEATQQVQQLERATASLVDPGEPSPEFAVANAVAAKYEAWGKAADRAAMCIATRGV